MNQSLELLCGKEGRSGVVSSRELLLCPVGTPVASDMIDISVPGGVFSHSKPLSLDEVFPSAPHKNVWLERQDSD